MKHLSEGKRRILCETRIDALIGFVPQNDTMNLVQAVGLWLAVVRSPEGSWTEVVFPGRKEGIQGAPYGYFAGPTRTIPPLCLSCF